VNRLNVLGLLGILTSFGILADEQRAPVGASSTTATAKPFRVVDLKTGSFVIDKPGNWVLTRSWRFLNVPNQPEVVIDVVADDVVLDFRGFEVEVEGVGGIPPATVINVQGNSFLLKNAVVTVCCEGGRALRSTGFDTQIEGLRGFSFEPIALQGDASGIRDSSFHARFGVELASRSTIENTVISCNVGCVKFKGNESRVLNSRIQPAQVLGMLIGGDGNVVAGNFVDSPGGGPFLDIAFEVSGNRNIVRDNTLSAAGDTGVAVKVSGTGNVIDGNIVAQTPDGNVSVGIRFEQNGNFYGDNRMQAAVPFDLGGTTQTNWGDNVGY
jgi:hypothetical protein